MMLDPKPEELTDFILFREVYKDDNSVLTRISRDVMGCADPDANPLARLLRPEINPKAILVVTIQYQVIE